MNGRELSQALRTGARVFGTLIISPSPRWPAIVADAGLDFVFIDTEHVALNREQLSWMCQLYARMGMPALVRIAEPDPILATMALDGGAVGIVAPYVETPAQVRGLVGAVKCRPLKGRRLECLLAGEPLEPALRGYIDQHNSQNVLVANIESTPAIDALDEILSVPGLDAVLVGPHDLTCSLGVPEQYDHPRFDAAVRTIIARARAKQVGAGIHFWSDLEQEVDLLRAGLNLLIHSADLVLFTKLLRQELQLLRGTLPSASGSRPTAVPKPHTVPQGNRIKL